MIKIKEIIKENEIQECLIPTLGDCWNPGRLVEYNCVECKYWDGCTYERKGKMVVAKKDKGKNNKKIKRKK